MLRTQPYRLTVRCSALLEVGDMKGNELKTAEVVLLWEVNFYKTVGR